jgi:Flp pilus assembly pilin Flp
MKLINYKKLNRNEKGATGMEVAAILILVVLTVVSLLALFKVFQARFAKPVTGDDNPVNTLFPTTSTRPS